MADPVRCVDIGIASLGYGCPKQTRVAPFSRDLPKRNAVVLASDFIEFGEQAQVGSKARERLHETGKALTRCIEDAVIARGVIEAIPKCAL